MLNNPVLIARLKSFLWRGGGLIVVGVVGFILQNLGLFQLTNGEIAVATLVLNEITKVINDKLTASA